MTHLISGVRWGAYALAAAGLVAGSFARRDRVPAAGAAVPSAEATPHAPGGGAQASSSPGLNPFRWDHQVSATRYVRDEPPAVAAVPEQTESPEDAAPTWRLTGVLWGDPPLALLEGVPGHQGPGIFGIGDQVEGAIVTVIWPDSVLLRRGTHAWVYALEAGPPGVGDPS